MNEMKFIRPIITSTYYNLVPLPCFQYTNHCCASRRCLALCYTMDTADIQAVARDHDYLRQLFTEYWIDEANVVSNPQMQYFGFLL